MVNSPFTKRAKTEARAVDPKSSAEAHRCGEKLATFLTVLESPVVGGKMKAFNEECHRLSCQQQGFMPTVYVGCPKPERRSGRRTR